MTIFRAEFLVDEQGKLSLSTTSDHAASFERATSSRRLGCDDKPDAR